MKHDLRNTAFLTHNDKNLCRIAELIAFDNGHGWLDSGQKHMEYEKEFLVINYGGDLVLGYAVNKRKIIDLLPLKVLFDPVETVELNGKKYIKSELEEALSKIKPIEE